MRENWGAVGGGGGGTQPLVVAHSERGFAEQVRSTQALQRGHTDVQGEDHIIDGEKG